MKNKVYVPILAMGRKTFLQDCMRLRNYSIILNKIVRESRNDKWR